MIEEIICQFHLRDSPEEPQPDPLPHTTSDVAEWTGWRQTTHRLFSQDGQLVWICPECVRRLLSLLAIGKDFGEADLARDWQRRTEDLQRHYQQDRQRLQEDYADRLQTLHQQYAAWSQELSQ